MASEFSFFHAYQYVYNLLYLFAGHLDARPNDPWTGFCHIWFQQFVIHAININKAAGTIYTPGLTTVLVGFIPNGVKYIQHCHAAGRLGLREFLIGLVGAVSFGYLILNKVTFTWLPDMDSPYPFSASEMSRFGARLAGVA